MTSLRTDNIYYAIEALAREADRMAWDAKGVDARDRARSLQHTAREAQAEYRLLSEKLPRLRSLMASADAEYDRYVTRDRDDDGCSCHINPPCSFCTRDSDASSAEDPKGLSGEAVAARAEGIAQPQPEHP